MNHIEDDLESEKPTYPAQGKKYTFQGKELHPYSTCRRDLYLRLTFDQCSQSEATGLFIFVCMQTPEKCVSVRTEKEVQAFRLEESLWRDRLNWSEDETLRKEAMQIHGEVTNDIKLLELVNPDFGKPPKAPTPGNE